MPWVAICERAHIRAGRNQNKTYVNIPKNTRQIVSDAATFVADNPTHPWADPLFHEFIIDLTDQEAQDIRDGVTPLFHSGFQNEPLWQQQVATSAATKAFGSFADPESAASVFTLGTPLDDDRLIIRLYDGDPLTTGVHIAALDLDEGSDAGRKVINMRLFNPDDTPNLTNAQNQQTEIAGKLMIFDFTAGISDFGVNTNLTGGVDFPSNHRYRIIGPVSEDRVTFRVFGRTLDPEAG